MTAPSTEELRPDPAAGLSTYAELRAGQDWAHPPGHFEILAEDPDSHARAGRLWTAHGPVETPCFMPVGTYGAVKGLIPDELRAVGSQVVLANAYHLTHRPGPERIRALGGIHEFMHWPGPVLTDSGGYQVFSLRSLQTIDDGGVDYRTHFDGSPARMTPRSVLEAEAAIGPDICMILDQCPPGDSDRATLRAAMERTTRWAREAADMRREILQPWQLCFAIVQGGTDLELRREHVEALSPLDFDGFALGGLSVGEPVPQMHATMAAVAHTLPRDKPRYVMGIGTPADLMAAIRAGVDMFDCVIPSRHARNGQLLTIEGRFNIRNGRFREDDRPPDPDCACPTCGRFSRAYLRHLHVHNDPLYVRLATIHNLYFFHQWVAAQRQAIRAGRFSAVAAALEQALGPWHKGRS
ncbi:tRNA guanosine(34) transglycosylase Tgt [Pseudenhygromyxa sp. WMMC2535]|uniref:tRNA guanosine(34) transglycosylase Tgt n=1 Tax=Pseudenhygromyxa sp. WMMC2535 TaxID=2712867 RepID=UPI001557D053|nr:tRNA guanosine(34) transglycosylase Tgt [Pseudenhygromyxa sp. WMMC2535]NVB41468.1 tRNA guanosine(34) transglycosylase Tgt [Pseudenhygromyxa sp. WMMC2535]